MPNGGRNHCGSAPVAAATVSYAIAMSCCGGTWCAAQHVPMEIAVHRDLVARRPRPRARHRAERRTRVTEHEERGAPAQVVEHREELGRRIRIGTVVERQRHASGPADAHQTRRHAHADRRHAGKGGPGVHRERARHRPRSPIPASFTRTTSAELPERMGVNPAASSRACRSADRDLHGECVPVATVEEVHLPASSAEGRLSGPNVWSGTTSRCFERRGEEQVERVRDGGRTRTHASAPPASCAITFPALSRSFRAWFQRSSVPFPHPPFTMSTLWSHELIEPGERWLAVCASTTTDTPSVVDRGQQSGRRAALVEPVPRCTWRRGVGGRLWRLRRRSRTPPARRS